MKCEQRNIGYGMSVKTCTSLQDVEVLLLVNVDQKPLARLMQTTEQMKVYEYWRSWTINQNRNIIHNIGSLKGKKEVNDEAIKAWEEKKSLVMRRKNKKPQEKDYVRDWSNSATPGPVFMSWRTTRAQSQEFINQQEREYKKSLDLSHWKDLYCLFSLGVFHSALMNDLLQVKRL